MLELSDELRVFLERRVEGIGEQMAEQCALVLAQERELLARALKKPELLNQTADTPDQ
jgi:dsDNA-binding SOS-regulon protein